VLVVSPRGGALEAFSLHAREGWQVMLARDRLAAVVAWAREPLAAAVVALELGSSSTDGLELCRELHHAAPDRYLMLITPLAATQERVRALQLGVNDCVPHPVDSQELLALLVSRLGAGEARSEAAAPFSRDKLTSRVRELTTLYALSPREAEILLLMSGGLHAKEAAHRLGCRYSTARTHLRRMAKKLRCSSTRELLVRFFNQEPPIGGEPAPAPVGPDRPAGSSVPNNCS
jgi:DNA-binding NarL/FixJ family response regulator